MDENALELGAIDGLQVAVGDPVGEEGAQPAHRAEPRPVEHPRRRVSRPRGLDRREPEVRRLEQRRDRRHPRVPRLRRAEEDEHRVRVVRLPHVDDPTFPFRPERVEGLDPGEDVVPLDQGHRVGRRAGAGVEHRDDRLAAGESRVQRREIRDDEREEAEADRRIGERRDRAAHAVRPLEAEREQGRAADDDRRAEAAAVDRPEDPGEAEQRRDQPEKRQPEHGDRRAVDHDPVHGLPLDGAAHARHPTEQAEDPVEDDPRPDLHPSRDDEGADRLEEHEAGDEPAGDRRENPHGFHRASLSRSA
jgi:hypothetical protein